MKEREGGGEKERSREGGREGGRHEGGGLEGWETQTCARASVMRAIHVLKGVSNWPFSDSSPLFFHIFFSNFQICFTFFSLGVTESTTLKCHRYR